MKNISLLPEKLKSYQKTEKKRNIYIAIALTCILVFVALYCVSSFAIMIKNGELKAVRTQRTLVQDKIKPLKSYEDMIDSIRNTDVQVKEAMGDSPDWGKLFAGLYNAMPDNIWLSDFSVKYGRNTGEYTIKGWAKTPSDLSDWLHILQQTEGLSDVQCQITAKDESNDSLINFEIIATLLPGKSYEIPVKEGKQP